MNNYICTSKGFIKSAGFSQEEQKFVIEYSEKIRDAQKFNTKAALKFMVNHDIEGFVWKPYAQDAIRNMYYVRQRNSYDYDLGTHDSKVHEWMPVKAMMAHDSDVAFLTTKKLKEEDVMTFDEAKTEALRLNMEMMSELNNKLKDLAHQDEILIRTSKI